MSDLMLLDETLKKVHQKTKMNSSVIALSEHK